MFELKNKVILIISPQKWGKMHISKHHYAIELTKRGNIVYFFNPPVRQFLPKIKISKTENYNNLYLVTYSYFFPYNLRFHLRSLFDSLQKIQIKLILNKIKKPDVTWCFDTNGFSDLNFFGGKITIYHPVDNINGEHQKKLLQTSDFVFSVSDIIIKDLNKYDSNKKISFINHGLSAYFSTIKDSKTNKNNSDIKACFVGNILLDSLDREATKKIISENPDVNFVFIGAYTSSNISGDIDINGRDFISFLKNTENVTLKGSMHPKNIAQEIKNADVLLVLIDPEKDVNKGSNSHKILEYLSIGKVIVSNHISTYADKRDLIEMVDEMHNKNLPALFKKVINNLDHYNSPEKQRKRIEFALDNTYEKQIQRIEKIISEKNA